jgi:hypothetical protein
VYVKKKTSAQLPPFERKIKGWNAKDDGWKNERVLVVENSHILNYLELRLQLLIMNRNDCSKNFPRQILCL